MTFPIDTRNIILENTHPHLVVLTPEPQHKSDLLKAFLLSGISCSGSSFKLPNGTKVTIANIEGETPTEDFHLAYYNGEMKKGVTSEQKKRILKWEKTALSIVNLFE